MQKKLKFSDKLFDQKSFFLNVSKFSNTDCYIVMDDTALGVKTLYKDFFGKIYYNLVLCTGFALQK